MVKDVMASKRKISQLTTSRNREQVNSLRKSTAYRARLCDELRKLDRIFDSPEVTSIIIEVPTDKISLFTEAMYSEDTAEYAITQLDGEPNKFKIQRAYVMFS
jgi:hypothetical protein